MRPQYISNSDPAETVAALLLANGWQVVALAGGLPAALGKILEEHLAVGRTALLDEAGKILLLGRPGRRRPWAMAKYPGITWDTAEHAVLACALK